jgi:hypothetical protein
MTSLCRRNASINLARVAIALLVSILAQPRATAAIEPPLRTGLWATQRVPENASEASEFESMVRENSLLSGVYIHIGWKELEKEPGKFDFSTLDKTIEVLRRAKRKYVLGVKPGAETPAFVFQQGAPSFQTRVNNPHRANFGENVSIPVPWDAQYQREFSRLIEEVGKRYAGDPVCVGVVLTCANFMSAEMHLPKTPEDRGKWQAMGDYRGKLLEVYKRYTNEWAKAFPKQQICLHVSQVLDLPVSFFEKIIDYGISKYPDRFTIQTDQLTGRGEDTGTMSYDLVLKYSKSIHHGFQSVAGFSHGGERMGSMEMAALNVVHANGEYWEIWHGDALNSQTTSAIATAWDEAKKLGYEEYKKKLIAEDRYQEQGGSGHRGKGRRGRRGSVQGGSDWLDQTEAKAPSQGWRQTLFPDPFQLFIAVG